MGTVRVKTLQRSRASEYPVCTCYVLALALGWNLCIYEQVSGVYFFPLALSHIESAVFVPQHLLPDE